MSDAPPKRHLFGTLAAVLPPALLSAQFAWVYAMPRSAYSLWWADDASKLVQLEFFLMAITPLVLKLAGASRAVGIGVPIVLIGLLLWSLWAWTADSTLLVAVAVLSLGRAIAAWQGPERRYEFVERWYMGLLVYGALLVALSVAAGKELVRPDAYWVAFCAIHYFILACVEAVDFYPKWAEAPSRRPWAYLREPRPMAGGGVRLVFAGEGFEVISDRRARPVVRVWAGALAAVLIPALGWMLVSSAHVLLSLFFWLGACAAFMAVRTCLRPGGAMRRAQVLPGEITVLEIAKGMVGEALTLTEREIQGISITSSQEGAEAEVYIAVKDRVLPVMITSKLPVFRAAALMRLVRRCFEEGATAPQLRAWFEAEPDLASLFSPGQLDRIRGEPAMEVRRGEIVCADCRRSIAANATRCGYCGLMYPAIANYR